MGIAALQGVSGNGAVARVLRSKAGTAPMVQAKLVVGAADDPLEREADRIADDIVRHWPSSSESGRRADGEYVVRRVVHPRPDLAASFEADPSVVRHLSARGGGGQALPSQVRRRMEARFGTDFRSAQASLRAGSVNDPLGHEAGEVARGVAGVLWRRAEVVTPSWKPPDGITLPGGVPRLGTIGARGGELGGQPERLLSAARKGGAPVEAGLGADIGEALGADLTGVRLHTGARAAMLSDQIAARAFTVGSDIFFRDGLPDVNQKSGLHLLVHELAHTVQQGAAPLAGRLVASASSKPRGHDSSIQRMRVDPIPVMQSQWRFGLGLFFDPNCGWYAQCAAIDHWVKKLGLPEPKDLQKLLPKSSWYAFSPGVEGKKLAKQLTTPNLLANWEVQLKRAGPIIVSGELGTVGPVHNVGHWILIVGADDTQGTLEYQDPLKAAAVHECNYQDIRPRMDDVAYYVDTDVLWDLLRPEGHKEK